MNNDALLNVAHLLLRSRANGPELRAVIWVQGCPILCPGCHNQEMLPFERRFLVRPEELIDKIVIASSAIEGITLTGGEPFAQPQAAALLLKTAKTKGLTTMVYSGYSYRHLLESDEAAYREMLSSTDILVAGPFIQSLWGKFRWKGSANQRVLFLSNAYSPQEIESGNTIDEEVHIDGRGQSVKTGFPATLP